MLICNIFCRLILTLRRCTATFCLYACVSRAKLLLRKKRFQEQILQKADGQLENLERLVHDLEFSTIEMEVRRHSVSVYVST